MARLAPTRTPSQIIGFVIHHSAVKGGNANEADLKRRVAAHNEFHSRPKPWELIHTKGEYGYKWLSYHYAVAQDGYWMPTQMPMYVRYHAGDSWRGAQSYNRWGLGILIEGNFSQEEPGDASLQAAANIIYNWERQHNVRLPVIGHRETGNSSCPGSNMGTSTAAGSPVWRIRQMANELHGEASAPIQNRMGVVTASAGLNVRLTPGGRKIGALPFNSSVEILDQQGKWLKIYYDDREAWAHGDYIREFQPAPTPEPEPPHNVEGRDEILLAVEYYQGRVSATSNPDRLEQLAWLVEQANKRLGEL